MASLLITGADGRTQRVRLAKPLTLGRSSEAELSFVDDAGLSRRHAAIDLDDGVWSVRDLGSKNGTRVNGKPIVEKMLLTHNDEIAAGQVTAVFLEDREPDHELVSLDDGALTGRETVITTLEQVLSREGVTTDEVADRAVWLTPAQVLLKAGRELAIRRPLNELFKILLQLAMEAVGAERGVLMTLERGRLKLQASSGGELRISAAVRDRVIFESASLLVRDVLEDAELQGRQSILAQHVRSLMAAPLQTDGRVTGLVYLDSSQAVHDFSEADLHLLTVLANVAAIRVEHERLALIEAEEQRLRAEFSQAAQIQKQHLPAQPPGWEGYELAGRTTPCYEVGGDYYDYVTFPNGRLGVLIADVAGKGLPAALLMIGLHARVQALAENSPRLDQFAGSLNRMLAVSCPPNRFISLFVVALDSTTGEFAYVNAGHNPPLLVRAGGDVEGLAVGGMPLGLFPAASYTESKTRLEPGDCLLLYTDGVTEAESPEGQDYELARLQDLLLSLAGRPVESILDSIDSDVEQWTASAPAMDDRTLVLLRRVQG